MVQPNQFTCSCGALGDLSELVGHAVEKFSMPENTVDHVIAGATEPTPVTEARQQWQRIVEVRQQLEQTIGATVEEIRRALAG